MYQITPRSMYTPGYTLVEMLVVVTIIVILAGVASIVVFDNLKQGRDAERQADLQVIKASIEQYRRENGQYPAMGCSDADILAANGWSRQQDCRDFIVGLDTILVPIPRDPSPGAGDGYVYRTNDDQSVYKIMVRGSVEQEVSADHPLQACGSVCGSDCTAASNSYGAWGGFASDDLDDTRDVVCEM